MGVVQNLRAVVGQFNEQRTRLQIGEVLRIQRGNVFHHLGAGDLVQFGFQRPLLVDGMKFCEAAVLAFPLLPSVGHAALLGGVGDAQGVAGRPGRVDDRQPLVAHRDAHGVEPLDHVFHRIRGEVLLGPSRKPKHHGEIAVLDT